MNQELITILLAMSPVSELNGSIPIAVLGFKFSLVKAYVLSVLGGGILVLPLSFFLRHMVDFLRRYLRVADRFFGWLFAYTRAKHARDFSAKEEMTHEISHGFFHRRDFYKVLALFGFVALPGPFSGVWSASLAAFVFGIPFWQSIVAITLGNMISGVFPALIIAGVIRFL